MSPAKHTRYAHYVSCKLNTIATGKEGNVAADTGHDVRGPRAAGADDARAERVIVQENEGRAVEAVERQRERAPEDASTKEIPEKSKFALSD